MHLQIGKHSNKTIIASSRELDLSRLELEYSAKVLKVAVTSSNEAPAQEQYQAAVADAIHLQAGEHIWLIAQSTGGLYVGSEFAWLKHLKPQL